MKSARGSPSLRKRQPLSPSLREGAGGGGLRDTVPPIHRRFAPLPLPVVSFLLLLSCAPKRTTLDRPLTPKDLFASIEIEEAAIAPDASQVAFVSDRTGSHELWTMRLTGGVAAAPQQITDLHERVSGLAYAPGGDLVFTVDHGGDERPDLWLLPRLGASAAPIARTDLAEEEPVFSPDGTKLAYLADGDRKFRFNVMVRDVASGKVTQLTHEPVTVYGERWSRDGKTIVATVTPDDQKGELVVIDVAKASVTKRIPAPRPDGMILAKGFLPDGSLLATATNDAGFLQLATVDLEKGSTTLLGGSGWDVDAAAVSWSGRVLVNRNVHGESEISVIARLSKIEEARDASHEGVVDSVSIDRDGGEAVLVRQTSDRAPEIVLVATDGPRTTTLVGATPARSGLSRASLRTFPSFDGTPIDAYVYSPRASRLGHPPPAVVRVHGGPDGQMRPYWSPTDQSLAEAGFVVIVPNYRGSTGYGRAFQDENRKDWGGGDLKDLLAVVDALAAKGEIDGKRVGIMGGSYGGYMTLRALTATPDRWAAGVDEFGMPDLVKDYELTEDGYGSWYETQMGTPKTDRALFEERSPVHALDQAVAPLLVLQGANDTEVPKEESDLVVAAWKSRGLPVEYVVYPDEGHGFTHRANQVDAIGHAVDFFLRHLAK